MLVTGARQVGKSTLTREIAATEHPAQALTLDDKTTRDAANADPTGFVAGLPGPVLIDEVQRSPDLLLAIKQAVDDDPTPGRFLLTGSANILTAPKIYDALAGRIEIVTLAPLAQAELEPGTGNLIDALFAGAPPTITGAPVGRDAFVPRAIAGGYPEVIQREPGRRGAWFRSYLASVIERDLRELTDIQKVDAIPALLRLLASQAANLYRARSISTKLGVDTKTVQVYTSLLETVFLIRRVRAWRPGIGSREIQAPKLFVTDSGLLAHLLGADESRASTDDQVSGKLYENFVVMETARISEWADTRVSLYHYRERDDEVDVILEAESGEIVCLECKAGATVIPRDYRPIEKLRAAHGRRFLAGVVLYTGAETKPLGDRLWAVPVSALWGA